MSSCKHVIVDQTQLTVSSAVSSIYAYICTYIYLYYHSYNLGLSSGLEYLNLLIVNVNIFLCLFS